MSLMFLIMFQIERHAYEVMVENGKLVYRESGMLVDTVEGSKWIFVLSTARALYVGQKKKGRFQHSSFLSGGATTAAGRLVAHDGILEVNFHRFIFLSELHILSPLSGQYLQACLSLILHRLCGHTVDIITQQKKTSGSSLAFSRKTMSILPTLR